MLKERLEKLRLKIKEADLDAILIIKEKIICIFQVLLDICISLITQNAAVLLTDFR